MTESGAETGTAVHETEDAGPEKEFGIRKMGGRLFESVRALVFLVLGMIFSKGFFGKEPSEYSLPKRILYYAVIILFAILSVIIATIVVIAVEEAVDWLFDLIWPLIWPK